MSLNKVLETSTHKIEVASVSEEAKLKGIEKAWRDSELSRTLPITQDPEHPEREMYSAYRTALYAYNLDGTRPTL